MAKAFYAVGFWIRETGQALDRLGCRLQGNYFFHEQSKNQQLPATRITLRFSPSESIFADTPSMGWICSSPVIQKG
jgi:hypothetical protein